jgi:hypothetical protein
MKNYIYLSLLTIVQILACSSKDLEKPIFSVSDLLELGIWTETHNFEDFNLDNTFVEFGDECEKDDRWTFKTDGVLNQDYGTILCDPEVDDPNTIITSHWMLTNQDKTLVIEFGFSDVKFNIESISESELVLNTIDVDNPTVFKQRVILNR